MFTYTVGDCGMSLEIVVVCHMLAMCVIYTLSASEELPFLWGGEEGVHAL